MQLSVGRSDSDNRAARPVVVLDSQRAGHVPRFSALVSFFRFFFGSEWFYYLIFFYSCFFFLALLIVKSGERTEPRETDLQWINFSTFRDRIEQAVLFSFSFGPGVRVMYATGLEVRLLFIYWSAGKSSCR